MWVITKRWRAFFCLPSNWKDAVLLGKSSPLADELSKRLSAGYAGRFWDPSVSNALPLRVAGAGAELNKRMYSPIRLAICSAYYALVTASSSLDAKVWKRRRFQRRTPFTERGKRETVSSSACVCNRCAQRISELRSLCNC